MKEEKRAREINHRWQDTLQASITLFREGKDHSGLDALLHSIEDLESLLDIYQCTGDACLPIDTILPLYHRLLICIQNRDITGMTDLLEYDLLTIDGAGREGVMKYAYSQTN